MKLTRAQISGLKRLEYLEKTFPPFTRFFAVFIGQSGARALRALDGSGLVDIDRRQSNSYGYRLTDAGRAALAKLGARE